MDTTLAGLKVANERLMGEDTRERIARARASLPNQQVYGATDQAAVQFGLPMTGQEIHERVRATLRPRWHLPDSAKVGVGIFVVLTPVFLGILMPWAWASWHACRGVSSCSDAQVGFIVSLCLGILTFVVAGGIFGGNLQVRERTSRWTELGGYAWEIPEAALLKWAEAKDSGLFKSFYVVEPAYERIAPKRRPDPWLIGCVGGAPEWPHEALSQDGRRAYVVLAYWE